MTDKRTAAKIKRAVLWYNMIPSFCWSVLNLVPVSVFCYTRMEAIMFYTFLVISLLTILIPNSFFNFIQLGKTTLIYKKIGVRFINKFTQNGEIINGLIRKQIPGYKVVSTRAKSIDGLLKQTYIFEKFHFMMFAFFCLTTIYALWKGYVMWAHIILFTNLVYNVYPNFLQQYLRIRLTMLKQNNLK